MPMVKRKRGHLPLKQAETGSAPVRCLHARLYSEWYGIDSRFVCPVFLFTSILLLIFG